MLFDYGASAALYGGALTLAILLGRRLSYPPGFLATNGSSGCTIARQASPTGSHSLRRV